MRFEMNRNGSKGRKRRRYSELDDSQKCIKVFCAENQTTKEEDKKLRTSSKCASESGSKVIPSPVGREKQTLLAPFRQTAITDFNCFRIKKMDSGKKVEKGKLLK